MNIVTLASKLKNQESFVLNNSEHVIIPPHGRIPISEDLLKVDKENNYILPLGIVVIKQQQ